MFNTHATQRQEGGQIFVGKKPRRDKIAEKKRREQTKAILILSGSMLHKTLRASERAGYVRATRPRLNASHTPPHGPKKLFYDNNYFTAIPGCENGCELSALLSGQTTNFYDYDRINI
jgi:hypothetical protein